MVHVSITESVSKTKNKRMNSFLQGFHSHFVLGGALTRRHKGAWSVTENLTEPRPIGIVPLQNSAK